jgi:hypothetical protein
MKFCLHQSASSKLGGGRYCRFAPRPNIYRLTNYPNRLNHSLYAVSYMIGSLFLPSSSSNFFRKIRCSFCEKR